MARYPDIVSINAFTDDLRTHLERHPVIAQVALAGGLPPGGSSWTSDFFVDGYDLRDDHTEMNRRFVDDRYFETMRIPLIRGRAFTGC